MTVGIGAICEDNSEDQKIVLAADRLVTTGASARIEFEHTNSKMVPISKDGNVISMGIASGSISLADDLFYKMDAKIASQGVGSTRDIVEFGVAAFQDLLQESIERQVLQPQGFTLDEFNAKQQQLNPQIVQSIYQDILQAKDKIVQNLNVLIGGVDDDGAHIYSLVSGDMARFDSIGYHTVGMGAEPANSTFIRNRYNSECDVTDALFSVVDAKMQAEQAQGVGREMDITILTSGDILDVSSNDVKEMRNIQEEISDRQQDARKSVIEEKDYTFDE